MVITAIERQKRRTRRVNIYIDGTFALGVHENVFVKYGLRKGDQIDERTLNLIRHDDGLNSAKEKALRLLSYRLRSEKELRQRLNDEDFTADVVNQTIIHLRELKLIDDTAFARAFVHDLILKKSAGKTLLSRELGKKGISRAIIEDALRSIDSGDEEERATRAAETLLKRYRHSRKQIDPRKQHQRIMAFLMRRGFDFSTINKVTRKLFSNNTIEEKDEP
jgi:regulatory protein